MSVDRLLIRHHGGKWMLAPWILQQFPPHRTYVEPYGGGASVLLRKERSYSEIYNDLDGEIVNLFRIVRDQGEELLRLLELTPFARGEFLEAWHPSANPVEQARRTLIRSFMGFGSAATTLGRAPKDAGRGGLAKTGFRANSSRSGTTPAHDWRNYPGTFGQIIERLRGVVIENKPALEVIAQHDSPDTLTYCDPPYVAETRDAGGDYAFEMNDADHRELAAFLKTLRGGVIVSGYACDLYDLELYAGWDRIEKASLADGARPRTEVLWMRNCEHGLFKP